MTELKLHFKQGDTGQTLPVEQDVFTIGRLPKCDLYLPFGGVSRCHARIVRVAANVWTIEDLGSKNGTKLNDIPIYSPQTLHNKDILWIGEVSLEVMLVNQKAQTTDRATGSDGFVEQPEKLTEAKTILRDVKQLQKQWMQGQEQSNNIEIKDKAIARLRDLVEIAKNLSAATSIEEIFFQVQQVVFRYLKSIERLALLVLRDGKLELMDAAPKSVSQESNLAADGSWISKSICQRVYEEKVAIQTADAQQDERFAGENSILVKGIRSAMAVPLWDETKVVGVLYADAHFSSYHWESEGEEELSFFSALANLVASSVQRWLLADKLKSEEVIRQKLERYHSPAVVHQLIAAGVLPNGRLPPRESEISILFADLVGFTAMSEASTPTEISQLLNNLFEEMLQEVFAYGGTLDKYIGDCIMAFFGAPEEQKDHADRAVASAKGMLSRLYDLNLNNFWREPLKLRIAINSGKAVVGDLGSSQRVDYTALGPTINLAARMEGVCPPGKCVVGEATHRILADNSGFEELGDYRFKGINRLVKVYQNKSF